MIFTCAKDFYEKVSTINKITREEEKSLAKAMRNGDEHAREKLIESYLIFVAARIKRTPNAQSLDLIYHCISALENAVEKFDFLQESETFSHRLSLLLDKEIVSYIARK